MAKLLTLAEMAEHFQISERTLKKYIRERQIPHIAFGRSLRFNLAVVEASMQTTAPDKSKVVELRPSKRIKVKSGRFAEAVGL